MYFTKCKILYMSYHLHRLSTSCAVDLIIHEQDELMLRSHAKNLHTTCNVSLHVLMYLVHVQRYTCV